MEKNQKTKAWILTGVVALVVILLIILFTILAINSSTPKQTIEGLLNNLKSGELENAQEFVTGEEALLDSAKELDVETQKLLFDKLAWKIINITEEEGKATIELEITNKDLKSIGKQIIKDAVANEQMSKEDLENSLKESLKNENVETITNTAKLTAIKVENKWKIEMSSEVEEILTPALNDVIKSIKAIDVINALT